MAELSAAAPTSGVGPAETWAHCFFQVSQKRFSERICIVSQRKADSTRCVNLVFKCKNHMAKCE